MNCLSYFGCLNCLHCLHCLNCVRCLNGLHCLRCLYCLNCLKLRALFELPVQAVQAAIDTTDNAALTDSAYSAIVYTGHQSCCSNRNELCTQLMHIEGTAYGANFNIRRQALLQVQAKVEQKQHVDKFSQYCRQYRTSTTPRRALYNNTVSEQFGDRFNHF